MDRKVPSTVSEEIELYERTIYSLLRSTTNVQLRTLEEVHASTNSLLHSKARRIGIDASALIYTWLRLPECMPEVEQVVMGQNEATFLKSGFSNISDWKTVKAVARRRHFRYDDESKSLAGFIASRSDIDDLVPTLVAFQIEWNKLHNLLIDISDELLSPEVFKQKKTKRALAKQFRISLKDLDRLKSVWGNDFFSILNKISKKNLNLRIRLLDGSLTQYWRATRIWWDNIEDQVENITHRPIYFVSSNTHVFINLISGYALQKKSELIHYLETTNINGLFDEWKIIENDLQNNSIENFLYYVLKKVQQGPGGDHWIQGQDSILQRLNISRIPSTTSFDIEAQVFELSSIDPSLLDPRVYNEDLSFLQKSNALIINIDYPLGIAAYNILRIIAENTEEIRGVYTMGKAATLNGVLGDIMIPNVIQDEHSLNTYLINNAFSANDLTPYLKFGTVLDNQKSVSVLGTFMQNSRIMDVVYREGYTDIEMEAGPFLSAVCEMVRPKRHPYNEIINLYKVPFDVGVLHYASDTPLSKGQNLGAGTLSYAGMDPTYGSGIAILKRIIEQEKKRCV
ncbi:MAG: hypothetical protein J7K85_07350 [Anaerolineaceae bacterium]|nr:hypothetical protein [Anaerolineaceae bacterium]